MSFWVILWKALFIFSIGIFTLLAIVVTIGGAIDIKNLFRTLKEEEKTPGDKEQ